MSDLMRDIQPMQVKVFSPFEIMYEGPARALSAQNALGPFDVLPDHTNFMTLLTTSEVKVMTEVDTRKFSIEHGILKVADNHVTVFANI
jgi:F0F1-type ATP synthase epsilon subunit